MSSEDNIPVFGSPVAGVHYIERPGVYAFLTNEFSQLMVMSTEFGFFLPGGGVDAGESEIAALERELLEETGLSIVHATVITKAKQYMFSRHRQKHFLKIGTFFDVHVNDEVRPRTQLDHEIQWFPAKIAQKKLKDEFQRWAVEQWLSSRA